MPKALSQSGRTQTCESRARNPAPGGGSQSPSPTAEFRGVDSDAEKLKQWTQERAIPPVAVVAPQRGGETRELVLPGNVDAFYSASIHGQVRGYVSEWRKDIGAKVKQGDVLAVVDTPELDQRIAVAQSELAKAKANLALAKVTADRWNSLARVGRGVSTGRRRKGQRRARKGRRGRGRPVQRRSDESAESLRQHRRAVRRRRHRAQCRCRIAGQGGLERQRQPCSRSPTFIRCGSTFPCRKPTRLRSRSGMKATLELPEYPDRTFDATIDTTSHAIDQKSRIAAGRTARRQQGGRCSLPARSRAVHFQLPPDPNAVTLPASAIMFRDNAPQVATVGLDNRIVAQEGPDCARPRNRGRDRRGAQSRRAHRHQSSRFDQRRARRSGSCKPLGRRRRGTSAQATSGTSQAIIRRALRRSRKQGGTTSE